jgi:Restriction endonuclease
MTGMSSIRPLTELNHQIEQAEAEASRLEQERASVGKDADRAAWTLRYLRLARWIRRPAATIEVWRTGLLAVAPATIGVLLFVLVHLLFGSFLLALCGLIIGAAAGATLFAALIYRPPDSVMELAIAASEANCRLETARLNEKTKRLTEIRQRLQQLLDERRDQIASGKLQRAALLQRNWKSMRGAEWEDFVVEVLRTHGATVERTARVGDQDANLVANFGSRRVAMFTEGEGQNVSSATIQHVIAARDRHGCNSCAVVINRRFTGAAQDFAQRNGCTAIGSGEFPDFVLGKVAL